MGYIYVGGLNLIDTVKFMQVKFMQVKINSFSRVCAGMSSLLRLCALRNMSSGGSE